jgi:octaprenyl-diphosphate synthase
MSTPVTVQPAGPARTLSLPDVRELVADDLLRLDRCIVASLRSEVALVNDVARYIVAGGGKRLRPLLVLLAARACGYPGSHHVEAAPSSSSFTPPRCCTTTLSTAPSCDAAAIRQIPSLATRPACWWATSSTRSAFQMMVRIGDMQVMKMMADATNTIAEGEVLQLMNCNDPDTDEVRYFDVIRSKTATLFEAGARAAAHAGRRRRGDEAALAEYGLRLGTAFQLVDDALDYSGAAAEMGKNMGDDLAEGKPTLPLIQAMRAGTADQREVIRRAIEQGGLDELGRFEALLNRPGPSTTLRGLRASRPMQRWNHWAHCRNRSSGTP